MGYLATFFTHYGAMRFHKHCERQGIPAKMAPVPRELSSSCGVCVYFSASRAPSAEEHEDLELCYALDTDGVYTLMGAGCESGSILV